jgi:signal transduction histidine kinase
MDKHNLLAIPSESELLWIESESLKQVTEFAERSKITATVMIVALFVMMYPYVDRDLWLIWAGLHGLGWVIRMAYLSDLAAVKTQHDEHYRFKNIFVVGSIALIWGSTAYPLLVGHRSNMETMVVNLILIYGIGGTINLASHLKSLLIFLKYYGIGLLGAVFAHTVVFNDAKYLTDNVVLLIFASLFIFVLSKVGKEINRSNVNALRLQYNNQQLINSLIVEKQTAVNAVDVKNRIMASATHDMRQPILALDLYTDLPVLVPKIAEATKSVITMFDAMFDLARMSMNQLTPNKMRFNLEEMLVTLEQQFQPMAKSKGLELRVRYQHAKRELMDDPILLRRILSNILSNAIKYTEHGGVLLVCRECAKHGLRIEVWDTGVGISPQMQVAVFSEFYKNPENNGTSDGFGLGLAIVAQLCVLLGYQLVMKSRRGRGTMLSVRLSDTLS